MKEADKKLIAQATAALRIRDIMLNRCSFTRPTPPPLETDSAQVNQFGKQTVQYVIGEIRGAGNKNVRLLQVIVELGIRIAGMQPENAPVFFEIEADFLVEYDLDKDITEAAIRAFADNNSVHNVWPFWRQHVFDVVSRGRLPHLEVPLYSVSRSDAE